MSSMRRLLVGQTRRVVLGLVIGVKVLKRFAEAAVVDFRIVFFDDRYTE